MSCPMSKTWDQGRTGGVGPSGRLMSMYCQCDTTVRGLCGFAFGQVLKQQPSSPPNTNDRISGGQSRLKSHISKVDLFKCDERFLQIS